MLPLLLCVCVCFIDIHLENCLVLLLLISLFQLAVIVCIHRLVWLKKVSVLEADKGKMMTQPLINMVQQPQLTLWRNPTSLLTVIHSSASVDDDSLVPEINYDTNNYKPTNCLAASVDFDTVLLLSWTTNTVWLPLWTILIVKCHPEVFSLNS